MKKLNDLLSLQVCVAWFLGITTGYLGMAVYPQKLPWLGVRVALEAFHFAMGLVCTAMIVYVVFFDLPSRTHSDRD